jgi:hypothetical protein
LWVLSSVAPWLFVGVVLWSLTSALESVFLSSSMPTARKGDLSNQERRACSGTFGHDGDDFLDAVDVDDGLVDSGSSTPRFHCLLGMARDNGPRTITRRQNHIRARMNMPAPKLFAAHMFRPFVFRYRNSILIVLFACTPHYTF